MSWLATLRGDLSGQTPEDAKREEQRILDQLVQLGGTLGEGGSTGMFGTFQGQQLGTVNLLDPNAPPNMGTPAAGGEIATGRTAGSTPAGQAEQVPPAYVQPGAVGEVATGAAQPAEHPGPGPEPEPGRPVDALGAPPEDAGDTPPQS